MKIKVLFFYILLLNSNFSFSSVGKLIADIENKLGITIILDTTVIDTWELVDYKKVTDRIILESYLETLKFELEKYPSNFFNKINLQKIVIGQDLNFEGVNRAAVPDPHINTMFFEVDSNSNRNYLINVIHHELHHFTEHAIWSNMYFKWKKWNRKNFRTFEYTTGGYTAYLPENGNIDWTSTNNPVKGFLNLYSTTGEEEDRSEIVAYLMNDFERHLLLEFCKKDRRLKRKTKLIMRKLDRFSGTKNNYWRSKYNLSK